MGLRGGNLKKEVCVNSSLGTRVSFDQICRDCESEILGILLTMNLRVMDISKFDVILRMDWLTAYRVVIDCERMRVTSCTQDNTRITFQGGQARCFVPDRVRFLMAQTVDGLASTPYPGGRGETGLGSPSGSLWV